MRMWMVDPATMCRKHLLGEHVELHMLVGHLKRGRKLGRYASDGLVEPRSVYKRHDQLETEMLWRHYNHDSPIDAVDDAIYGHLGIDELHATIDRKRSLIELHRRCSDCAQRYAMEMLGVKGDMYVGF